jgi:tRNA threonylcarbamoyladenosine biosynthesis protein TsaE
MANQKTSKQTSINTSRNSTLITESPDGTRKLGKELAGLLKPGDIVCLKGDLGSGKTTFVQGVLKGFGVRGYVRSSSFMIVNQYKKPGLDLFHIDLYRLSGKDFESFGLEEYIHGKAICLIEWADKISRIKNRSLWDIRFRWKSDSERKISIGRSK